MCCRSDAGGHKGSEHFRERTDGAWSCDAAILAASKVEEAASLGKVMGLAANTQMWRCCSQWREFNEEPRTLGPDLRPGQTTNVIP
jgi:hypothetical protein